MKELNRNDLVSVKINEDIVIDGVLTEIYKDLFGDTYYCVRVNNTLMTISELKRDDIYITKNK